MWRDFFVNAQPQDSGFVRSVDPGHAGSAPTLIIEVEPGEGASVTYDAGRGSTSIAQVGEPIGPGFRLLESGATVAANSVLPMSVVADIVGDFIVDPGRAPRSADWIGSGTLDWGDDF